MNKKQAILGLFGDMIVIALIIIWFYWGKMDLIGEISPVFRVIAIIVNATLVMVMIMLIIIGITRIAILIRMGARYTRRRK